MNKKYYNLVFINHWSGKNNYLFKLPMNIQLKANDKVFVNTIKGATMGYCISDSFMADDYTVKQIITGTGAYEPLKSVIGWAAKRAGYDCIDFKLVDVPF